MLPNRQRHVPHPHPHTHKPINRHRQSEHIQGQMHTNILTHRYSTTMAGGAESCSPQGTFSHTHRHTNIKQTHKHARIHTHIFNILLLLATSMEDFGSQTNVVASLLDNQPSRTHCGPCWMVRDLSFSSTIHRLDHPSGD